MAPQLIVPQTTMVAIALACAALFLIPIALLIVLGVKKRIALVPLLAGFASFFIAQPLTRVPLLSALGLMPAFQQFITEHPLLYAVVVGGVTAGLFEETARLVGASLLKKHRSWKDACSFGWGHGFCEVFLITGMAQVNNLLFAALLNSGASAEALGLPAETLAAVAQQLTAAPAWMFGISVVERVFAVIYHLSATILIFWGVNHGKRLFAWIVAVGCHTLFNTLAVLVSGYLGIIASEIAIGVMAVVMLVLVLRLHRNFLPAKSAEQPL